MDDRGKSRAREESGPLHDPRAQGEELEGQGDWYAFRIEGHLRSCWSEWLGGLTIANLEGGESLLTGQVADQAALHGLLAKIRDLNLPLISVNRLEG